MIDRRTALLGSLAAGVGARGAAGAVIPSDPWEQIILWPDGAPGAPSRAPPEAVIERSRDPLHRDRAVTHVARPRLTVFRPSRPNGLAALVMPGGGYVRVVVDKEGYELGHWLSARGWTVFVLFYRLPGDGWAAGPDVALADAQRAMRLIRSRAAAYRIRTDRVAALGFSAGGHLCGDLAGRFGVPASPPVDATDVLSARPDLAGLIYPVQSMILPLAHPGSRLQLLGSSPTPARERAHSTATNVSDATPPCFLVHAEDDPAVPVENSLEFRAACRAAGVPADLHLFANGGHGFGMRGAAGKPAAIWPELFRQWAEWRWTERP